MYRAESMRRGKDWYVGAISKRDVTLIICQQCGQFLESAAQKSVADEYVVSARHSPTELPDRDVLVHTDTNGSLEPSPTIAPRTTTEVLASQIIVTNQNTGESVSADILNEEAMAWKNGIYKTAALHRTNHTTGPSTGTACANAMPICSNQNDNLSPAMISVVSGSHDAVLSTAPAKDTKSNTSDGETRKESYPEVDSKEAGATNAQYQPRQHDAEQGQKTASRAIVTRICRRCNSTFAFLRVIWRVCEVRKTSAANIRRLGELFTEVQSSMA